MLILLVFFKVVWFSGFNPLKVTKSSHCKKKKRVQDDWLSDMYIQKHDGAFQLKMSVVKEG